jgi:hypothetical protein
MKSLGEIWVADVCRRKLVRQGLKRLASNRSGINIEVIQFTAL